MIARQHILIKRLHSSKTPIIPLVEQQVAAIARFRAVIDKKEYNLAANPCLCGGNNDLVIACRDRYGLDVRTVLCNSCGLMRTDPYLDHDSIVQFYEYDYRKIYMGVQNAEKFFFNQFHHGQEILRFVERENIDVQGYVLEVGCGAGGILQAFKQRGFNVAGCDFGKTFLEYGRKEGLCLEYGDALSLQQYKPARLVILSHVLEHFRNPVTELRKLRFLLDENSCVYIEVPGLFWFKKSYASDLGKYLQNAHVYHFCLDSLDYVMSLAGFMRIAGDERICALYRVADSVPLYPSNLASRVILYLRQAERLRQLQLVNPRRLIRLVTPSFIKTFYKDKLKTLLR